jgi:hypothetical protein
MEKKSSSSKSRGNLFRLSREKIVYDTPSRMRSKEKVLGLSLSRGIKKK